jgi:DMSO reductase anchor subunit
MHPAYSVIAFTTASGAGYGLLIWLALAAAFNLVSREPVLGFVGLGAALVLITIGLLTSTAHLGRPERAWRALSQWRSSWLSREGVAALLCFVPAIGLGVWLWLVWREPTAANVTNAGLMKFAFVTPLLALTLLLGSLITVACTAMIYVSLVPVPAWRHRLVLPVYLLFAVLCGGLLLGAIAPQALDPFEGLAPLSGIALALALSVAKWRYWRAIDAAPPPAALGAAIGMPEREVSVFERPHTEANYLTREMGFVLARRHGRRLRRLALALFGPAVIVLLLPTLLLVHGGAQVFYALAAASALLGAVLERWLFFAQARHVVSVYYEATA